MLWIKTVFNLLIPDYAGHVLKSERLVHCKLYPGYLALCATCENNFGQRPDLILQTPP